MYFTHTPLSVSPLLCCHFLSSGDLHEVEACFKYQRKNRKTNMVILHQFASFNRKRWTTVTAFTWGFEMWDFEMWNWTAFILKIDWIFLCLTPYSSKIDQARIFRNAELLLLKRVSYSASPKLPLLAPSTNNNSHVSFLKDDAVIFLQKTMDVLTLQQSPAEEGRLRSVFTLMA